MARSLKALTKKYRSLPKDLEMFERLMIQGVMSGHEPYAGLGCLRDGIPALTWKGRVLVPQLGGKRNGLRYIYERGIWVDGVEWAVCLAVYTHHEDASESEIRSKVVRLQRTLAIDLDYLLEHESTPES